MVWVKQEETNSDYWIPDILPNNTEEYNKNQLSKKYYTLDKKIRYHPQWFYENQALVCDDYLFYNEGWKLYNDTHSIIEFSLPQNKILILNPEEEWICEEKIITPTFEIYELREKLKPTINFSQELFQNPTNMWVFDKTNKIAQITWQVKNLNENEIAIKENNKWEELRNKRNQLLQESDLIVLRSYEKSIPVNEEVKLYRQKLRDLPNTITSIRDFNEEYPELSNPLSFYI